MVEQGPMLEGVRAFVVKRDLQPKWKHTTLAEVTPEAVDAIVAPFADAADELTVTKDGYAEIFHETYNNYESIEKDTQSYIGGSVAVSHDWNRRVKQMPKKPLRGQTGGMGW